MFYKFSDFLRNTIGPSTPHTLRSTHPGALEWRRINNSRTRLMRFPSAGYSPELPESLANGLPRLMWCKTDPNIP